MIDLHCHILPNVDDGPDSLELSLKMLEQAHSQGIEAICATPHVDSWANGQTETALHDRINELREAASAKNLPVELYLGSEIYFSLGIENLRQYTFSSINGTGRYWLVEFATDIFPSIVENFVSKSLSWNRIPILAHAERYKFLNMKPKYLRAIIKAGALIQIDAGCFVGQYGKGKAKLAQQLITEGLCHIIASDAHDIDKKSFHLKSAFKAVKALIGSTEAKLLFRDNPRAILEGLDLPAKKSREEKQASA